MEKKYPYVLRADIVSYAKADKKAIIRYVVDFKLFMIELVLFETADHNAIIKEAVTLVNACLPLPQVLHNDECQHSNIEHTFGKPMFCVDCQQEL